MPRLADRTALDSPPKQYSSKIPTGRLPEDYGRAPNRSGLYRHPSQLFPTPPSRSTDRLHPPTRNSTSPHPLKNPPHHRTRPSSPRRRGLRGSAVHAPANDLRSRWIPPPPRSLGLRWTPPTQPPLPLPMLVPPLSDPHTPLSSPLCAVVDLTRPNYRKVFLSPGTKGFPPARTWFVTNRYQTKTTVLPHLHSRIWLRRVLQPTPGCPRRSTAHREQFRVVILRKLCWPTLDPAHCL